MVDVIDAVEYASPETYEVAGRVFPNHLIFRYDTARWNLRKPVEEFFETSDLEHLHLTRFFDAKHTGKKNSLDVGSALRDAVAPIAAPILKSLIFDHVARWVGSIRSVQPLPMMRVNFHGSRAILRFHRDNEYGQQPNLINLWIPVTSVWGSNSMYVESVSGASDFKPLELEFGQGFMFRGYDLLHGTMDNDSGSTRVTYDLRFSL